MSCPVPIHKLDRPFSSKLSYKCIDTNSNHPNYLLNTYLTNWTFKFQSLKFIPKLGGFQMTPTFPSCQLLVLFLVIGGIRADFISDLACKLVNCGEGVCVPRNVTSNGTLLLPFDCQCNQGWKSIQIGTLTFPSCIVPNCTMDFSCGGQAPSEAPAPPSRPPLPNPSDPCALTWCGEGACVSNGTTYACQCSEGSANLLNNTKLACFKECFFGADCHGLGFGPEPKSPDTSGSARTGTPAGASEVPNSSRTQHSLIMLLIIGISLAFL